MFNGETMPMPRFEAGSSKEDIFVSNSQVCATHPCGYTLPLLASDSECMYWSGDHRKPVHEAYAAKVIDGYARTNITSVLTTQWKENRDVHVHSIPTTVKMKSKNETTEGRLQNVLFFCSAVSTPRVCARC